MKYGATRCRSIRINLDPASGSSDTVLIEVQIIGICPAVHVPYDLGKEDVPYIKNV